MASGDEPHNMQTTTTIIPIDEDLAVQKCLHMLKSASSDTEKFAALLLVTKLVQAEATSIETRRRIFNIVGFKFLNRLLNTKEATPGCDVSTFHSLALTMLACFSTDVELLLHPEMINKIPLFKVIIMGNSDIFADDQSLSLLDDVYQILLALVNSPTGREKLMHYKTIGALCQIVRDRTQGSEKAFKLLIFLLHHSGKLAWQHEVDSFIQLLESLSKDFGDRQDLTKFELCDQLTTILEYSGTASDLPSTWKNHVFRGISDLVRNKLNESQRDSHLMLVSAMVQACGVEWALGPNKDDTKTLLLIVHMVCIEVRMILENATDEKRKEKAAVLSACYVVLENVIEFMLLGPSMGLDEKQTLQLHAAMTGAFGSIIFHLKNAQEDPQQADDPVTRASIRVLSTWLAEETSALKERVYEILPFLIHIATKSFQETVACISSKGNEFDERVDLLRLMLPGLCHLTVEALPRSILVEHNCMELLMQYFNYQWQLLGQEKYCDDSEMALATLCNIFLNVTVEEPEIITRRPIFDELLCFIMSSLPTLGMDHLVISFNLIVLGLMQLRHFAKQSEISCSDQLKMYMHSIVQIVIGAHSISEKGVCYVAEAYQPFWQDIMELWYLGMQVLTACLSLMPWLSGVLLETEMIKYATKMLGNCKNPHGDMKTLFGAMLTELAKHSEHAAERINRLGGMDIARMHRLEELAIILQR